MENKLKIKIWAVALVFAVTGVVSLLVVLNKNTDIFKGIFGAQQFAMQKTLQTPRDTLPASTGEIIVGVIDTAALGGNCDTKIEGSTLYVQAASPSSSIPNIKPGEEASFGILKLSANDNKVKICKIKFKLDSDLDINEYKLGLRVHIDDRSADLLTDQYNFDLTKYELNFTNSLSILSTDVNKPIQLFFVAKVNPNATKNGSFWLSFNETNPSTKIITNAKIINATNLDRKTEFKFGVSVDKSLTISNADTPDKTLQNDPGNTQEAANFTFTQTGGVVLKGLKLTAATGDSTKNPFMFASNIVINCEGCNDRQVNIKDINSIQNIENEIKDEIINKIKQLNSTELTHGKIVIDGVTVTFDPAKIIKGQTPNVIIPQELINKRIEKKIIQMNPNIDFTFYPLLNLDQPKKLTVKINLREGLGQNTTFKFGITKDIDTTPADVIKPTDTVWGATNKFGEPAVKRIDIKTTDSGEIKLNNNQNEQDSSKFEIKPSDNSIQINKIKLTALSLNSNETVNPFLYAQEISINDESENLNTQNLTAYVPPIITEYEVRKNPMGLDVRIPVTRPLTKSEIDEAAKNLGKSIDFPLATVFSGTKNITLKIKLREGLSNDTQLKLGISGIEPSAGIQIGNLPVYGAKNSFDEETILPQDKLLSVSLKPSIFGTREIESGATNLDIGKITFIALGDKEVNIKTVTLYPSGVTEMPFTNISIPTTIQSFGTMENPITRGDPFRASLSASGLTFRKKTLDTSALQTDRTAQIDNSFSGATILTYNSANFTTVNTDITIPADKKLHDYVIKGDLKAGITPGSATFGIKINDSSDIEATYSADNRVIKPEEMDELTDKQGSVFKLKAAPAVTPVSITGGLYEGQSQTLSPTTDYIKAIAATFSHPTAKLKGFKLKYTGTLPPSALSDYQISLSTASDLIPLEKDADGNITVSNQLMPLTGGKTLLLRPKTTLIQSATQDLKFHYTITDVVTEPADVAKQYNNFTGATSEGADKAVGPEFTLPKLGTGTLTLTNIINGGTAIPADFPLSVERNGSATQISNGNASSLAPGSYVAKSINSKSTEYTQSKWTGDCAEDGTVTVALNTAKACAVTYTAITRPTRTDATLKLINYVVGSARESDFNVEIDGVKVERNSPITQLAGPHRATTSANVQNYTQSEWRGDCAADGTVTVVVGTDKMCHVTWNFVPPPGTPTCEEQGKVTYTGPTAGTLTTGMCIACSMADFVRYGNTCTPPVPPDPHKTCEEKGKYTYTGPEKPGVRTPGMCIDCTMEVYQALGGTCTATVIPDPIPNPPVSKGTTPGLRGSARIVKAPEQGNTGPEVAIYFGALAATQAVLWLRKKRKNNK